MAVNCFRRHVVRGSWIFEFVGQWKNASSVHYFDVIAMTLSSCNFYVRVGTAGDQRCGDPPKPEWTDEASKNSHTVLHRPSSISSQAAMATGIKRTPGKCLRYSPSTAALSYVSYEKSRSRSSRRQSGSILLPVASGPVRCCLPNEIIARRRRNRMANGQRAGGLVGESYGAIVFKSSMLSTGR